MFADDPARQQLADEVLNWTGSRQTKARILMAQQANAGWTRNNIQKHPWFQQISADGVNKNIDLWNKEDAYTTKRQNDLFDRFRTAQLAHLDLKPEALVGILGGELRRQSQTQRGISQAVQAHTFTTAQTVSEYAYIKSANQNGALGDYLVDWRAQLIKENGVTLRFKEVEGGPTVGQQVDEYITKSVENLIYDGYIKEGDLEQYINTGIIHPAGKTAGHVYVGKENIPRLMSAAKAASSRHLGVLKQHTTERLATLQEQARLPN